MWWTYHGIDQSGWQRGEDSESEGDDEDDEHGVPQLLMGSNFKTVPFDLRGTSTSGEAQTVVRKSGPHTAFRLVLSRRRHLAHLLAHRAAAAAWGKNGPEDTRGASERKRKQPRSIDHSLEARVPSTFHKAKQ